MPTTPNRTISDAGRQPSSSKPKRKGKSDTQVAPGNGRTNNGPFSDKVTFSDSAPPPTQALTPAQKKAKTRAAAKATRRKRRQTTSLFDRFVQLLLVGFILFTVQQCHSDTELKSPVCRAVNQRILEPFVLKPFNTFIAHPSVAPAIQSTKPYYAQAVKLSQPLIRQAQRVYIMRIAPHVAQIEKKMQPYVRNLQLHYTRNIAPYVRTAQINYTRLQHALEPYVNQAFAALLHLWFEIQPTLIPLIEESKFIPEWVRDNALIPFLQLREQYVDTHVYKMLQTVEEFGESRETKSLKSGNHVTQAATSVASTSTAAVASGTDATHSLTATPAVSEAIEIEPTVIAITPKAITPSGPMIPDAPPATPAATASASPDADDVESWLAELRADVPQSTNPEPTAQPEIEETEEQIAERMRLRSIATAEKRADLEKRHAKFETDIHELGKSAIEDFEIFLSAVRSVASSDFARRANEHVRTLKTEAEKGLKGTDAYLKKLKGEPKGGAIKVALFDDVVGKVEKRFMDTAQNVSALVSSWWSDMHGEEQKEANLAAEAISTLAHDAQANLGMEYAWLEDVTVADWSRYHALIDFAETYAKQLQDLVDGTHPDSEPNPLQQVLDELQGVLNEIIDDFQSKLKLQHENGIRSFGTINPDDTDKTEQSAFSFPPGAAAREDGSMLQRGKEEVEAAIKRAEAEVGTAAENVQAIFEDGLKQAGEAAHQATRTIIKAAGGTPSPETFQETAEYVAAKVSEAAAARSADAHAVYEDAPARYEQMASRASRAVHDVTRSAGRAAGYTPEPETPQEHAESIIAQASSTIVSVATAVSSATEDAGASVSSVYSGASASVSSVYTEAASTASSVYSDVSASAHQATRSLSRAAGYQPTPETPREYMESVAAAAMEAAHQASRSASRAAGYTPTPETPSETIEYVSAVIGEHVESMASAVSSSASSVYNEATRTVIKAAGGTPSPANIRETAESLAAGAQAYYAEAASKLPSYEDLKGRAGSLVGRSKALLGAEPAPAGYEKLLDDMFALIDEYQTELASRAHSATRAASRAAGATPTPETFEEHIQSAASGVSSIYSAATDVARGVIHEDL